ncbi:immunity protein YezG family protein [Fictibacillus enclensis]|uniref:immunity protein YezG family protein n=1 Tax=Fictibacillus enclensis TaxID=1017270 RepID=UPI003D318853
MENIYHDAANLINQIIPELWATVYIYALFYYVSKESNKLIYSHNIPKLFNVEQDNYDEMYHNLYFIFDDLRSEFIKNQQEVWTSLIFT